MVLTEGNIIGFVQRTKRVSNQVLQHFGRELRKWVQDNHQGNQTQAAKDLGVTQSHISAMIAGTRGPGLNTILLMREITGRSLDELLGVGPPPPVHLTEQLRASLETNAARERFEARQEKQEAVQIRAQITDLLEALKNSVAAASRDAAVEAPPPAESEPVRTAAAGRPSRKKKHS